MKSVFLFCTLLSVTTVTLRAQTVAAGTTGNSLPAALQKKAQAFADSRASFATRNYAAAEITLLAGNQSKAGSPQWHVESGAALMRMAFAFLSDADATTSSAIAQRALAHLKQADQAFGAGADAAGVADENELMGYLYENLLGDRTAAKRCYQTAVKLSPNTGHAADLLAALLRTEAEEAKKQAYVPGQ